MDDVNIQTTKNNTPCTEQFGELYYDDMSVLQSVWVRHRSVLSSEANWKSLQRQHDFIFVSGTVFWFVYIVSLLVG
jgi:hypothetical protein